MALAHRLMTSRKQDTRDGRESYRQCIGKCLEAPLSRAPGKVYLRPRVGQVQALEARIVAQGRRE